MTQFKKGDPVWVPATVEAMVDRVSLIVDPGWGAKSYHVPTDEVVHRTGNCPQATYPQATSPVHVVKLEATRRTVRTPENDGGLYSEESEDNDITLVTAAGHRIELAPWVVDALRMELSR